LLHITNGDLTAEKLRESDLPGHVMPWRDVLHEGPLPPTDDDEAFARRRADFIGSCGWGEADAVFDEFVVRDQMFADALVQRESVVLWFEHDLYDQLQLLQILTRVGREASRVPVDLICIDSHPEVASFTGLSQLSASALAGLFPSSERVRRDQIELATQAWLALCDTQPQGLAGIAAMDRADLPFLPAAIARLIDEYPSERNGLSVTENRTCALLAEEPCDPTTLFGRVQAREEAPFMGDWSFWRLVAGLSTGQAPLVQVVGGELFRYPPEESSMAIFGRQRLALTETGAAVLAGKLDALEVNGIDRWVGGVHLTADNDWRRRPDGRLQQRSRRNSLAS